MAGGTPPASQSSPNPQSTHPKFSFAPTPHHHPWGRESHEENAAPLLQVCSPPLLNTMDSMTHPTPNITVQKGGSPHPRSRKFSQGGRAQCPRQHNMVQLLF